jgi:putative redox protein
MSERPTLELSLTWEGGLRFRGDAHGRGILLDGDSRAGISPVEALGLALAACMASDVVHILGKQRAALRGCAIRFAGRRAETEPRRLLAVKAHFSLQGAVAPEQVERAIALSRDKYCSVWHSMKDDIEFLTSYAIEG